MRGYFFAYFLEIDMAAATIRNSLVVQPHLYIGDSAGRPLDYGMVYFGQPNKDPEFYPIDIFYDEALTVAAAQPVRTKGGFLNANGDMTEIYAQEVEYSVKVLDSYGRKILYEPKMLRAKPDDMIVTENGMTQRELNALKADKVAKFGSPTSDVLYRLGEIYESKGTVVKQESRPFLHDFRPTVADGSEFNTDGGNLFVGVGAGNFTMKAVPDEQVPAGFDSNLQASHNVGYGVQALRGLTIGYKNVAVGNNAGRYLTDGHGNVLIGQEAARGASSPVDSVLIGFSAGYSASGTYNVALGAASLYQNADGQGNVALGRRAAFDATTGSYNINVGEQSGFGRTSGSYNINIGKSVANNGITTADGCVVIGSRVTGLENTPNQVVIADGAGNKRLEINPSGAGRARLDLVGREATPVNLAATDGQNGLGSTVAISNTSNSSTSFAQLYLQSRVGKPGTRMVVWGDLQRLSIVQNTTEALRVESDASVQIKTAAAGATTLNSNGMVGFELLSNTQLAIKVRGSDGVTRTASLALA